MKVQGITIPESLVTAVRTEMLSVRAWRSSDMVDFTELAMLEVGAEFPDMREVAVRLVDRLAQKLRKEGRIVCRRRIWEVVK